MRPDELRARHVISLGPAMRAVLTGVRAGELGVLAREAQRRFRSDWRHYGLRRDLEVPFEGPRAKIELTIRELRPGQGDDEQRMVARPLQHVLDERHQGLVGPLEVLEHHDDGPALGQAFEEEPPPREQVLPARGGSVLQA